jgi:hypothetical protein
MVEGPAGRQQAADLLGVSELMEWVGRAGGSASSTGLAG